MKYLFIIGLILGLTNCSLSQDKLAEHKAFRETFTKTEIEDLQYHLGFTVGFKFLVLKEVSTRSFGVGLEEIKLWQF